MPADTLQDAVYGAMLDLCKHEDDYDAIVVAGDAHAISLGASISTLTGKPLMIVYPDGHDCAVSVIVTIGAVSPSQRFLYVDDYFAFGASKKHTTDFMLSYMNQSEHAPIVATYEVDTGTYKEIPAHELSNP
jgi:hypothetical protein